MRAPVRSTRVYATTLGQPISSAGGGFYPEEGLVVALLTNTWGKVGAEGAFMRSLAGELADIMLSAPE